MKWARRNIHYADSKSDMLLLAAAILALASVAATRGHLNRLLGLRIRASWLLLLAFAVQFLAMVVFPHADRALLATMHIASYGIGGFVVVANRHVRGLPTIGFGGLLNVTAITANGGTMPASAQAMGMSGLTATFGSFENSAVLADPNVPFLGDIFAVPASWPLSNVFSIGDVLIVVGAAVLLHFASGTRVARARWIIGLCRWC